MLLCSHFIQKDRDLRHASSVNRSSRRSVSCTRSVVTLTPTHLHLHLVLFSSQVSAGDFDIPTYAHQDIDRFAVLLDVWSQETAFLECKKEVSANTAHCTSWLEHRSEALIVVAVAGLLRGGVPQCV